jgi:carbon-monoxide dehydrogenase medium subunit
MISREFDFHTPSTVAEAVELLGQEPEAKALAGGMSLVPAMNLGLARPARVVSLNRVDGLDEVKEDADSVRVGAMVRHARIASDPVIARSFPLLARAASVIGDVQVRNRGTLGGSIAHADPAADYLPVLLALGATFRIAGGAGERTVPARDFVLGVMQTVLAADELLVEVELPKLAAGTGSAYLRLARLEGSFPIANAAAAVDGNNPVVAIGGATAAPLLVDLGGWGEGAELDRIEEAARTAAAAEAFDDLSATAEYRGAMAGVLARRAVESALAARGAA